MKGGDDKELQKAKFTLPPPSPEEQAELDDLLAAEKFSHEAKLKFVRLGKRRRFPGASR